jgi:hypothetical protein
MSAGDRLISGVAVPTTDPGGRFPVTTISGASTMSSAGAAVGVGAGAGRAGWAASGAAMAMPIHSSDRACKILSPVGSE